MATHEDMRNEDWLRTMSWGLGDWDNFTMSLGVQGGNAAEQKAAIARFMHLPAAEKMPADIRARYEAL